jgi:hypothetical protein
LIGAIELSTVLQMPLHFGKIGAAIAIVTVAAFVLWLLATTFFATEQADEEVEQTGAITLPGGVDA